ncbi:MAG: hypothetical protein P8K76_06645 [Candidatus Binatia bacterium]|nr:hypothetical protein [Candidatus Binatia bacterium]
MRQGIAAAAVLSISALGAAPASAWYPDYPINPDKDIAKAQKFLRNLQKDNYKQGIKYVACVVKATNKCSYKFESPGSTVASCNLVTYDDSANIALNPKFYAAVEKCSDKQDFTKKQPKDVSSADAYTGMGCPGDADSTTTDVLEDFADLESWQIGDGERATLAQIDALGAIVRVLETDTKQQYKDVGTLSKYASGLGKCIEKCETDVKNKKGNGGTSDSLTACAPGDAGVDANMQACLDKNTEKLEKKVGAKYASIVGIIDGAYAGAANATWNKPACSGIYPGGSPSGAFVDGAANF